MKISVGDGIRQEKREDKNEKKAEKGLPWIRIIFVCALLVAVVFAAYFLEAHSKNSTNPEKIISDTPSSTLNPNAETLSPAASVPALSPADATAINTLSLNKKYQNSTFRFRLSYPDTFKVTELPYDSGAAGDKDTGANDALSVLFKKPGASTGIQINISPFDDPASSLTAERIKREVPNFSVESPQSIDLGPNGKGIAFIGVDTSVGGGQKTREAWFVFKGKLYQITTDIALDGLLQNMLNTWQFF